MSWVTTSVVMAGANAYGQIQSGNMAGKQAQMQAMQSDWLAEQAHDDGLRQAAIIRRAGARQVSESNAAYAGAGVSVGQGSALDLERQTMREVQQDAFQAILNGDRQARGLQLEGVNARTQGSMARTAGRINAATSLMSSASAGLKSSGWRSNGPGFSNTQAPAPVEIRKFG